MDLEISLPDSIKFNSKDALEFRYFLQAMANRFAVGQLRYGKVNRSKRYLTRMQKELRVYRETGNFENLLNAAVYGSLEAAAPQNRKFHFDPTAASATRAEVDS